MKLFFCVVFIVIAAFAGVNAEGAKTGYYYDAKSEMWCGNDTHYSVDGRISGYSHVCRPMLSKLTEKSSCFPGDATVQMQDGSRKMMSELEIGDVVRTGQTTYEAVTNWLHRYEDIETKMVKILIVDDQTYVQMTGSDESFVSTARGNIKMSDIVVGDIVYTQNGEEVIVTAQESYKQYVDAENAETANMYNFIHEREVYRMIASHDHFVSTARGHIKMSELVVGDTMYTTNGEGRLAAIVEDTVRGVYAPYTKSGYIMVDDVLATVYAKYMPSEHGRELLDDFMKIPYFSCSTGNGMHCVSWILMHLVEFFQSLIMSK